MKKRIIILLITILVISLLGGCAAHNSTVEEAGRGMDSYEPTYDYEKSDGNNYSGDVIRSENIQDYASPENSINLDQKIIKNGSAIMEVTDYTQAYGDLEALIGNSGYIQSSNIWKTPRYIDGEKIMLTNAELTIRIEETRFSGFFKDLANIGLVISEITGKDDISYRYFDTEARIKLKEDEKLRLEQYLKEVDDANIYFEIQSRITDVLYEIEQLRGNILRWDDQIEYATIRLTINEIGPYDESTITEPKGFFGSIWENLLDGVSLLGDAIIFLAGAIPALLLITLGVILVVKLANKKKKKSDK